MIYCKIYSIMRKSNYINFQRFHFLKGNIYNQIFIILNEYNNIAVILICKK